MQLQFLPEKVLAHLLLSIVHSLGMFIRIISGPKAHPLGGA